MRLLVLAAAAGGLAAAFVLPLRLEAQTADGGRVVMPGSSGGTTVSIHPAPGRPESSATAVAPPAPAPQAPVQAQAPAAPAPSPAQSVPPPAPSPEPVIVVRAEPAQPERALAQRRPARPDDRAVRAFVPE